MYREQRVAVIVPAYNEELLIGETLHGIPSFVDRIFVINDGSRDGTLDQIRGCQQRDPRVELINHEINQGLGQSLIDGYLVSAASEVDITAIMAGDNQMDPRDLPKLLDALIDQKYDYVKGNRLMH